MSMSSKDERRAERDNERACEARDAHMKTYEPEWYKNRSRSGNYSSWLKTLKKLSQQCKGSKPDSNNRNVCEEDIGDLSDILYQLNLGTFGGKKGGSKQTGGAVTSALLTKLNGWISKHQDEISDCAQYFLEKIYGAVALAISNMINEATVQNDSHTFQFLITLISKLNQNVKLLYESEIKVYIQSFLFQNISILTALQELSLRDLAYYILLGINLFQYVDPAKGVVLGAIDTILDIDFIGSKEFLNLLYELSQSGLLTTGLLLSIGFRSLTSYKQKEIKNIYKLIDHNIDRIVAGYIRSGVKNIDNKIKDLITSNNAILLGPFDEHLKQTFIDEKIKHSFKKAEIINKIQIETVNISDATLVRLHEDEITSLKGELSNLKTQLIAVLTPALPPPAPPVLPPPAPPVLPPRGGKRGKSTRRKIGSQKNKRVQKKKSTKKR